MILLPYTNRFVGLAESGVSPLVCMNDGADEPDPEGGGETLSVEEIDAEEEPAEEEPAPEPEPEVLAGDTLDSVLDDLYGEADPEHSEGVKQILGKPDALKSELQKHADNPVVKTLVRALRTKIKQYGTDKDAALQEREKAIAKREAELVVQENDFISRREAFSKISDSPEIQALLAKADTEVDADDVQGLITKKVAESMKGFLDPMRQENAKFKAQQTMNDLYRQYPRLKDDKAFKTKVATLVKNRKESGSPVSTHDAVRLVEYQEGEEKRKAEKLAAQKARANAAAQIGRRAGPSGQSNKVGIPAHIKGAVATAKWLRDNPEMAKRIRDEGRYNRVS